MVDVARAGQAPPTVQVLLLTTLAGVCSVGQRVGAALAVAGIVWLVTLGFVVNTMGVLRLTGTADAAAAGAPGPGRPRRDHGAGDPMTAAIADPGARPLATTGDHEGHPGGGSCA